MNSRVSRFRRLAGGLEDDMLFALDSCRGLFSRDIYGRLTAIVTDGKDNTPDKAEERSDYPSEPAVVTMCFERGWD